MHVKIRFEKEADVIDKFGDDYDADETAPLLPNLGHLSTDGESPMSGVGHANAGLTSA